MSLSFVAGLVWLNLAGMPAAENPLAFATLGVSLLGLVVVELPIFKVKDWF